MKSGGIGALLFFLRAPVEPPLREPGVEADVHSMLGYVTLKFESSSPPELTFFFGGRGGGGVCAGTLADLSACT